VCLPFLRDADEVLCNSALPGAGGEMRAQIDFRGCMRRGEGGALPEEVHKGRVSTIVPLHAIALLLVILLCVFFLVVADHTIPLALRLELLL